MRGVAALSVLLCFVAEGQAQFFKAGEFASSEGFDYRDSRKIVFCEAKYGGLFRGFVSNVSSSYFPEIGSVVSAPLISWLGLHMLLFWDHDSNLLFMISALFVVNGVGSFLFHYNGLTRWGDLDGASMLLAMWTVCGFVLSEVTEAMQKKGMLRRTPRRVFMAFVWIFSLGVVFWVTTTNAFFLLSAPANATAGTSAGLKAVELGERIGSIVVAAPLATCVLVAYIAIYMGWVVDHKIEGWKESERIFRRRFHLGFVCTACGVCIWNATEQLCDTLTIFKWIPGHMIWHISVAYGLTNCLIYATTLRADNVGVAPRLRTMKRPAKCWGWLKNIYFLIFPAFSYPTATAKVNPEEEEKEPLTPMPALAALERLTPDGGEAGTVRSRVDPDPHTPNAVRSEVDPNMQIPVAPKLGRRIALPPLPPPAEEGEPEPKPALAALQSLTPNRGL